MPTSPASPVRWQDFVRGEIDCALFWPWLKPGIAPGLDLTTGGELPSGRDCTGWTRIQVPDGRPPGRQERCRRHRRSPSAVWPVAPRDSSVYEPRRLPSKSSGWAIDQPVCERTVFFRRRSYARRGCSRRGNPHQVNREPRSSSVGLYSCREPAMLVRRFPSNDGCRIGGVHAGW